MNNYEKIKNMSIEEMVEFLILNNFETHCDVINTDVCRKNNNCRECLKTYLQQEDR